jgi:hypothetical protein
MERAHKSEMVESRCTFRVARMALGGAADAREGDAQGQ